MLPFLEDKSFKVTVRFKDGFACYDNFDDEDVRLLFGRLMNGGRDFTVEVKELK